MTQPFTSSTTIARSLPECGLIETLERRDSELIVPEAAAILRVAPGTVYWPAMKHVIPGSFGAGGTVRFNPQKLAQWMHGGPA